MTILPLAALFVVSAAASIRPTSAEEASPPAKIDPKTLSVEARARYEADPAGFEREHGDDLEAMRRWSQDPSLGQSECLAAKQDPRNCMERRLTQMREVARPEQLAVINSYVKLLPRGVDARLPAAGEDRGAGQASGPTPAPGTATPSPRPAPTPSPRQQGAHFNAPPPAQRQTAAPEPAKPGGAMSVDQTLDWLCTYVPCSRT